MTAGRISCSCPRLVSFVSSSPELHYLVVSAFDLRSAAMSSQSTFKGTFRVFLLVATCCVGSFLFAYDTGIIGGVLTLSAFQRDFKYSKHEKTTVASNSNSLLQAGGTFVRHCSLRCANTG